MSKAYCEFTEQAQHKFRTKFWLVRNKTNGSILGQIHWFAPWRQYVFAPADSTIHSAGCLREITAFLEAVHWARWSINGR